MWLPKEQLYILVYLITVSHSMMAGYMDKAQKFTDNALGQIEKLRREDNRPILSVFHVTLLEHIIMCRLIMGHKTAAIRVSWKRLRILTVIASGATFIHHVDLICLLLNSHSIGRKSP